MEPKDVNLLKENLFKILPLINCEIMFLTYLFSNKVLTEEEMQILETTQKREGSLNQTYKLLKILFTKQGAFQVLINALKETEQTGALEAIQDAIKKTDSEKKRPKVAKFCRPPGYLNKYLSSQEHQVFLVSSDDPSLTCERIFETVPNCVLHSKESFIESISAGVNRCSDRNALEITIVNCGETVLRLFPDASTMEKKVILVDLVEKMQLLKHAFTQEEIKWTEISPFLREEIFNKLQRLTKMNEEVCLKTCQSLPTEALIQLIRKDSYKMFNTTIPTKLKYYIPRELISRYKVSPKIFKSIKDDVFLIEGIERHQLSVLAPNQNTDFSGNIINLGMPFQVKFVVLESPSHVKDLIELATGCPVHHLSWEDPELTWRYSHGSIEYIQDKLDENQSDISEANIIDKADEPSNNSKFICISDTPGMGKSVLLANIASSIKNFTDEKMVHYLTMSDIVQQTQEMMELSGSNLPLNDAIFQTIGALICCSELGVLKLKTHKSHLKHLLLDAFDELPFTSLELGYHCLQELPKVFLETTFWITTRPHLLLDLERKLSVLGYNIKPFDNGDQLNFLIGFWNQEGIYDPKRLLQFSTKCLETLKSKLNSKEDFAGIPLQCLLIGEVYRDEAIQYCLSAATSISSVPRFKISSVLGLYEELIRQKFEKFLLVYKMEKVDHKRLEQSHVYLAVKLLFSSFLTNIVQLNHNYDCVTICSAGIMEPKPSKYHPEPQFIHRTFAEYFVAKYIFSTITTQSEPGTLIFEFIYQNVLATETARCKIRNNKITAKLFKNNVVCYFLDRMLVNHHPQLPSSFPMTTLRKKFVDELFTACIYDNYGGLFTGLIYNLVLHSPDVSKLVSDKSVILSTSRSGMLIVKIIYEKYKQLHNKPLTNVMMKSFSLLHISVIRGNFSVVEHLISKEQFSESLTLENLYYLLCECVKETLNDTEQVLLERQQTVEYFWKVQPEVFKQIVETKQQDHPLFSGNIHSSLAIKLFPFTTKCVIIEFLHKNLKTYTCEDLKYILSHLHKEKMICVVELFDITFEEISLLERVLQDVKLNVAVLEFLKTNGVLEMERNNFCLYELAIKHKQDPPVVNWLVNNSSNPVNPNDLLDYLLKRRDYHVLDHLLQSETLWFYHADDWSELVWKLCKSIHTNSSRASVKKSSMLIMKIIDLALTKGASLHYTKSIAGSPLNILLSKSVLCWDVCKFIVDRVGHQWVNENPDYSVLNGVIDAKQKHLFEFLTYILRKQLDGNNYKNSQTLFLFMTGNFKPQLAVELCVWYCERSGKSLESVLLSQNGNQMSVVDFLLSRFIETFGGRSSRNEEMTNISQVFHPEILQNLKLYWLDAEQDVAFGIFVCRMALIKSETFTFCYESRCNELANEKYPGDRFPIYIDNILSRVCRIKDEKANRKDLVKVLLECGADVNEQHEKWNMPLYCVADNDIFSGEIWEMLVKAGAKLVHPHDNTKHPLIQLICRHPDKYSNLQSEILEKRAADVLFLSGTVLCYVIWNCELKTVRELCEWHTQYGEKPMNYLTGWVAGRELTCLHAALLSGNGDVLEYVNVTQDCKNILNSTSKPSLVILSSRVYENNMKKGKQKFVTLLKMIFPFKGMRNAENDPELESEYYIRDKVAEYWIELGGRVDATDEKGNTLLHHILSYYEGKLFGSVSKLVKSGASVNAQNLDFETPLHKLSKRSYNDHHADVLKLFLVNNADFTICDSKENSLLHNYSRHTWQDNKFHCVAEWFLKNGFRFDYPSKQKRQNTSSNTL